MKGRRVINMLEHSHIPYQVIQHRQTFTSTETAAETHTKGREFAKPIIVNVDGELVMAVLPASYKLDLRRVKEIMGGEDVRLATEEEFSPVFQDSVIGAMPPFGNLYGLPVIMDKDMEKDETIAFNACNHRELVRMQFTDYNKMVHPRFAKLHRDRPYHRW